MGIGISVFLMAVGAILTFGVNAAVPHANLDVIGYLDGCRSTRLAHRNRHDEQLAAWHRRRGPGCRA